MTAGPSWVELTDDGRGVAQDATRRLNARVFTDVGVSAEHLRTLTAALGNYGPEPATSPERPQNPTPQFDATSRKLPLAKLQWCRRSYRPGRAGSSRAVVTLARQ